jgi:hypothetical protein
MRHWPSHRLTAVAVILLTALVLSSLSDYLMVSSHAAGRAAATQTQTDLPVPSWWTNTPCDTSTVSNSFSLGASFRGGAACGPIGLPADSAHTVVFPGGWGEYEW